VDRVLSNYEMIALCTYSLDRYNKNKIIDVIINHQFALIKRKGKWERIENSKRKKAEDQIKILANIVELSNDAIIITSPDGTIIDLNKSVEQIYGYSAKKILEKPIAILEPPILVEETEEFVELLKQGDRIHNYETLRLRKDGKIINISLTLFPIFDASENLIAVLVIGKNTTKLRKLEEKLQKFEEKYRIVTEHTEQVVYDYDSRTEKCNWAGSIEEVTGYSFEELKKLGKNFRIENIYHTDRSQLDDKSQNERTTVGKLRKKQGYGKKTVLAFI
jgi:PAS domain S-box-containing protein